MRERPYLVPSRARLPRARSARRATYLLDSERRDGAGGLDNERDDTYPCLAEESGVARI